VEGSYVAEQARTIFPGGFPNAQPIIDITDDARALAQAIVDAIREAMRNALAGKEAVVPPGAMEWVYSKDAARGTVMALDAKDLGSRVFNITMGGLTTPSEKAAAIEAAVPGARVKFEAPAGTGVSLSNRDTGADLSRAKRCLGYQPQFRLHDAVKDLCGWMQRYMA
jgi:nucleoside-diphosphate-sugar epimerase